MGTSIPAKHDRLPIESIEEERPQESGGFATAVYREAPVEGKLGENC